MQTKELLFGLVCYSVTLSVYADVTPTNQKSTHVVSTPDEDCSVENPASFRFTTYHREANGIGYDQGYTSFDGFFAFSSIGNWHPFFDIRLHFFNDWKAAANTGFGIRYQPDSVKAIFGLNGFFDFRHANHSTFEQLGGGFEILGTKWETRANCYFPIINRNNLYDTSFIGFSAHQALFSVKRELAFKGFDVSLARTLVQKQYYTLSSTLGGYMFFADFNKKAEGGLFKLKSNISNYFSLEVQTSYDTLFGGIVQGQVGLSVPFGKKVKARKKDLSCQDKITLASRIVEPVDRFEIIVTDHHNTQTPALDPRTDAPLYIVFVNNLKSGGNGTAEAPFGTLLDAQDNSAPGEMIYVYGGTGNTVGMNAGITLQDRQWLQGSVIPFVAVTAYGIDIVPAQSTSWPTVTNSGGDTITLGNANIVRGFNLLSTGNTIVGSGISGFTGAYINSAGTTLYDFAFTNVSGAVSIKDVKSFSQSGVFLSTTNDVVLTLQDNFFINSGAQNLNLSFNGTSNSKAAIQYNVFENSTNGSIISTQNDAQLAVRVEENEFVNIQSSATSTIEFSAANFSTMIAVVTDNTSTAPTLYGFNFLTTDTATSFFYVQDNTGTYSGSSITSPYPFNFEVDTDATSTLLLQGNIGNNSGFLLTNANTTSTFYVQSPDLALSGVSSLNEGSFTTAGSGTITYISYVPDSTPNLE